MAIIFNSVAADVTVAIATCLVGIYLYFANVYSYWKRRGVHYIQPTPILGNITGVILRREHIGELLKKVYDNNPDKKVVGLYALQKPLLMIRDLDLLRNVMVKDAHAFLDRSIDTSQKTNPLLSKTLFALKGKKWRHMRIKLTPTFTSGKIKKMFYLINECGKQLLPCIDQEMTKGKCVVKDTVARYSTDVIASCAFGLNANALSDPNSEFRSVTKKIFDRSIVQQIVVFIASFVPQLGKRLRVKAMDESVDSYIRKTFWDVAEYRKKNNVTRKDFVDILLQIKHEGQVRAEDANDLEEMKQDSKYTEVKHLRSDKEEDIILDDDDYVAQAFIFIAAGFETSSSVISFTLYELALNPGIQDKLRQEILQVLDKHNSQVTYDAIAEMSYLEMVVSETLRKYPTLPLLERKCLSDYKIPGTDITIAKETSVLIPVLAIHLDPAIYPEPKKFDPERFSTENKRKRSNFAHVPFGEGPRICIGMRFGQMQVKTALVHILTTYKVKPCAETPLPPLEMKHVGVNTPKKDIVLAFEKID